MNHVCGHRVFAHISEEAYTHDTYIEMTHTFLAQKQFRSENQSNIVSIGIDLGGHLSCFPIPWFILGMPFLDRPPPPIASMRRQPKARNKNKYPSHELQT